MKQMKFLLHLIFIFTVLNYNSAYSQTSKELVVLIKYKTLPGKDSIALSALKNLITNVKKEPDYIDIKIHVDPSDKTNILLYEKWASEDYYKVEHMKTPHLQQFMIDARTFLGGPPDISFWKLTTN